MKIEITSKELKDMEVLAQCMDTTKPCRNCPNYDPEKADCKQYLDKEDLTIKTLTTLIERCEQAEKTNELIPINEKNIKNFYALNYDNGDDTRFIKLTNKEFLFLIWFIKNYGPTYFTLVPIESITQEYCETLD
jgi:hypothetical protein